MALTNSDMAAVIAANGSVSYRGQVISTVAGLPSDAQIATDLGTDTAAQKTTTGGTVGAFVSESELYLTDNTTGDASTSQHGLVPKLNGFTTSALMGDGSFRSVDTHVATVAAADLNNAANVVLYTVPTGKTFIPTKIIISNASISLTTWSGSIGFTTAAFTDVVANAAHTGLTGPTLYEVVFPKVGALLGVAGAVLTLKNNTLQGAPATATIRVFGILF